jgi:hypothetical protein
MEEKENKTYFTTEALARLAEAQGKTVQKVICHLWQNATNKNDVVELIDNLELHFTNGQKLTISCNENGDGLDVIDFNYRETAKAIENEFEGKIKIFSLDASGTKMWKDVIGKKLIAVQITKENDYYLADSAMLNFGTEKRVVSVSPMDGLLIDYYEE